MRFRKMAFLAMALLGVGSAAASPSTAQGWTSYAEETVDSCVSSPADVAAWWPLDEVAGVVSVDVIHRNDGSHVNGPMPTAGQVAGALDFDGVDDYVEVADAPELDVGTGDFSLDLWVKTGADSGVVTLVDKRTQSGSVTGYSLFLFNGFLGFQLADGVGSATCSSSPSSSCTNYVSTAFVADDEWHFLAVTVERGLTTGGSFYVDGLLVGNLNPTVRPGSLDNASPLRLGSRSFAVTSLLDGALDEVELFKRALGAAEVQALFDAGAAGKCKCTLAPSDLSSWWPLDDSDLARDLAGPNPGTLVNGPLATAGKVAGALDFDGVDDYVEVADAPELDVGTGDFSLDLWVKTGADSGVVTLVDKRTQSGGVTGYSLFLFNGFLSFQLADGVGSAICSSLPSSSCTNYVSTAFVADDEWHFLTVTVERGLTTGGSFYVDGQLVENFNPTVRPGSLDNASVLRLGSRSSSVTSLLDGALDEVELFKRALGAAEVLALFNAGPAGKCEPDVFSDGFESGDTSAWTATVP